MYSHFFSIVRRVLDLGFTRQLLWLIPSFAAVSLVILCIPAWRKREKAVSEGHGILAAVTLFFAVLFRLSLIMTVLGFLSAGLLVQQGLFSEKHGRVTQRNYEAVRTKWGVPHEQHDLRLRHFIMKKVIEEELANGSRRERVLEETQPVADDRERIVISEEEMPAPVTEQEVKLNPRRLVRRVTAWVRYPVQQESVESSDVELTVRSNPRQLGGAIYAGYDDTWRFKYGVCNRSEYATQAVFQFPLPAGGHGVYDRLSVRLDGQDWIPQVRYTDGQLEWRMEMKPGEKRAVEIGYASRGLEYFRYKPGSMRERCSVTVHVKGIEARRLNFPIGSMPPNDDLRSLSGDEYSLHWDLSRAVSDMDIGLIVPTEEQPGYYIVRLLSNAPLGLALLTVLLFLTRWLVARRVDSLPVGLVLLVFYISHALLANLNDVVASFPVAFGLSVIPLAVAATLFWRKVDGRGLLAVQSGVLFWLFAVVYPLASLSGDFGGTMLHVMYAAIVLYLLVLVAWNIARSKAVQTGQLAPTG